MLQLKCRQEEDYVSLRQSVTQRTEKVKGRALCIMKRVIVDSLNSIVSLSIYSKQTTLLFIQEDGPGMPCFIYYQ